jgi:hypothetical protein
MTRSVFNRTGRVVRVAGAVAASMVLLASPAYAGPTHGKPAGPSPACDRLVELQAQGRAYKAAVDCPSTTPSGGGFFDLVDIF